MSDKPGINVVLYWHMHQPEYRNKRSGKYYLPWTYLHTIKDYVDMADHLETHSKAHAVINFAPILLEQIDDYAAQVARYFEQGSEISDPLLDALVQPVLQEHPEQRLELIKQCLRANENRLIKRFPAYVKLAAMARWIISHPDTIIYVHDQFIVDLLTWFHLAWLGETVRRKDEKIQQLIQRGTAFTYHDRKYLLRVIGSILENIIERYRSLALSDRVELSLTPYAHPIMPLLLDMHSAREAMPEVPLPLLEEYPGGESRTRWHLDKAIEVFNNYFGFKPAGCWPSEGSISEETVKLLDEYGFSWLASGETVLRNSLNHNNDSSADTCLHKAYRLNDMSSTCFFRDDGLSDQIGFTYSEWHADDAVANLVHHLENIATACADLPDAIVSIILDGENAWEFYPENGYYFLDALYEQLSAHPHIKLTTYSKYLQQHQNSSKLDKIIAGSWVYGTFSTWIGEPDKNRAWDMLCEAKKVFDQCMDTQQFDEQMRRRIEQQMAICEGSDWFWWFGDYNPGESVSDFDYLFRLHLSHLYMLLGVDSPAYLAEAFSHGSGSPAMGGTMRPGTDKD